MADMTLGVSLPICWSDSARPDCAAIGSRRGISRGGGCARGALDPDASKPARAGDLTRYAEVVQAGLGEMRGATRRVCCWKWFTRDCCCPHTASDAESAPLQQVNGSDLIGHIDPGAASRTRPLGCGCERKNASPRVNETSAFTRPRPTVAADSVHVAERCDKVRACTAGTEVMAGAVRRGQHAGAIRIRRRWRGGCRTAQHDVAEERLKTRWVNWRVRCEAGEPRLQHHRRRGANVATAKAVNPCPQRIPLQRDEEEINRSRPWRPAAASRPGRGCTFELLQNRRSAPADNARAATRAAVASCRRPRGPPWSQQLQVFRSRPPPCFRPHLGGRRDLDLGCVVPVFDGLPRQSQRHRVVMAEVRYGAASSRPADLGGIRPGPSAPRRENVTVGEPAAKDIDLLSWRVMQ